MNRISENVFRRMANTKLASEFDKFTENFLVTLQVMVEKNETHQPDDILKRIKQSPFLIKKMNDEGMDDETLMQFIVKYLKVLQASGKLTRTPEEQATMNLKRYSSNLCISLLNKQQEYKALIKEIDDKQKLTENIKYEELMKMLRKVRYNLVDITAKLALSINEINDVCK